jgi:hypothetical protein
MCSKCEIPYGSTSLNCIKQLFLLSSRHRLKYLKESRRHDFFPELLFIILTQLPRALPVNCSSSSRLLTILFLYGSVCWSPAAHRAGPSSIPDQSVLDFCWTKWQQDRFLSESFGFPLRLSFR